MCRLFLACIAGAGLLAFGQDNAAPVLRSERVLTDTQRSLIVQGTRLHDQGKLDEAIELYQRVLKQNPDTGLAWYELAFAQAAQQKWAACIESARTGLTLDTPQRTGLSMVLANCLDSSGDAAGAVEAYQRLLAGLPADTNPAQIALIRFNLGITFRGLKDLEKAKAEFQKAIELNPRHASSHFQLTDVYLGMNHRVPALLAAGVFLSLEPPTSSRAQRVAAVMRQLLDAGVSRTGANKINIVISAGSKGDPEGDFGAEDTMLGIAAAANQMDLQEGGKKKRKSAPPVSEFEKVESLWSALLETMFREDRATAHAATFVGRNYLSFYRGLREKGLVGAFVSSAVQTLALPVSDAEKLALAKAEEFRTFAASWRTGPEQPENPLR